MQAVSQRGGSWRFDIVDQQLIKVRELSVDRLSPPTLSTDTSRSIKRSLSGVNLPPPVIDTVNVITDRVKVTMILDDGTEWPQGVFLFSDVSRAVVTAGMDVGMLSLLDQGLIVDQQSDTSISFTPGTLVTDAIATVLGGLPVQVIVATSPATINPTQEAVSWPSGTSRMRIVNELAAMAGFHELYFDNDGVGQLGPMPNPDTIQESQWMRYPVGGRTYLGSVTRSTDILELPNRFVVVNNGATDAGISGRYDVPAEAAHSAANRGFVVAHVEQMQGIATDEDAAAAARSLARSWRFPYETVEFSSPPDPRHDHYDIVNFEGLLFLELSWSMSLQEGSAMRHVIRRTYEGEGEPV